jgi:hypothetical protein
MESSNTIPRKRGQPAPITEDLPDFLQDSPYLPVGLDYDEDSRELYKKPSIRQILKSKKIRNIFTSVLLGVVVILAFRTVRRISIEYWYSGPACLSSQPIFPTHHYLQKDDIDWSRYAYAQYATNTEYLCNSVMIFEALDRLGSKASRMLMYPATYDLDTVNLESQLLLKARDLYNVKLVPIQVQHRKNAFCKLKVEHPIVI